ncbi:MAG: hypothetical protein HC828_15290 [Blastochloris sp.]|nr:hypothetical protein [Blastochloris sp.]
MQYVPTLRILVANEPCAYREVIASTFQRLRPDTDIHTVDPDNLDREIISFSPHLIVCSKLTAIVDLEVHAWVVLYPEGQPIVVSQVAGRRTTVSDIAFDGLLNIVERVEQLTLIEM